MLLLAGDVREDLYDVGVVDLLHDLDVFLILLNELLGVLGINLLEGYLGLEVLVVDLKDFVLGVGKLPHDLEIIHTR